MPPSPSVAKLGIRAGLGGTDGIDGAPRRSTACHLCVAVCHGVRAPGAARVSGID